MAEELKRTPLYDAHVAAGARMVPFGGWHMPVQYPTGIIKEHRAVREAVGVFDVSHMGEGALVGPRAGEAVQRLITHDARRLDADGKALYTVMCNDAGGIVDDCIVYRRAADDYLIVLNASNIAKDLAWMRERAGDLADVRDESDATALLAVQGPRAVAVVDRLSPAPLADVPRFSFVRADVAGVPCMVARTGYTGEDGFELACAADRARALWDALIEAGAAPCGLGARDTLRLEARLCLYGNDIDETTTPYEAGLGWVVKLDAGDFIGRDALRAQQAAGVSRKLIGFRIDERAIARHGYPVVDAGGEPIGQVTSGTKGISVPGSIGLAYVPVALASPGGRIAIDCRGKRVDATVVKGPFYKREDKPA
ncbi:MAG: glycine cleavage system aminomethyltransferase GcvT [Deltaproteobacteria bacterium]|nr:MAG: glycine cleavage system aminomethyltransferase GcvT [Deltaproteobacteria bacterium]